MVKVLTVLSGLDSGGVENILYNFYLHMKRDKVQIDFIVHGWNEGKLESKFKDLGACIYHVTPKKESFYKNFQEIIYVIKNGNYDIVHSRMNYKGLSTLVAAALCGIKNRMIHCHLAYVPETFLESALRHALTFPTMKLATTWLACSVDAAKWFYGEKAVRNGKVIIVNNAIDVQKFKYNALKRKEVRQALEINKKWVIGMVGRFHWQKNHDFMLEIFKEIAKQKEDAVLLLVGNGERFEEIKSRIDKMEEKNKIMLLGARTDVNALMQAMDIFILPTRFEGWGNVFIEAQASGLFCITSKEGVPKETNITNKMEYVSLKESAAKWAEIALRHSEKYDRNMDYEKVQNAGFNVVSEVASLENIYLNSVEKLW